MIKKSEGQLMVELMVAVSLLVIGLLGAFAVLSESLGLNRTAGNQYIATNLAAEGVEVTKNIVDANFINGRPWNDGLVAVGTEETFAVEYDSTAVIDSTMMDVTEKIGFDTATGRYSYDTAAESTPFRRTITVGIDSADPDEMKVASRVYWTDRGVDFEIVLEDRFKNWRSGP